MSSGETKLCNLWSLTIADRYKFKNVKLLKKKKLLQQLSVQATRNYMQVSANMWELEASKNIYEFIFKTSLIFCQYSSLVFWDVNAGIFLLLWHSILQVHLQALYNLGYPEKQENSNVSLGLERFLIYGF